MKYYKNIRDLTLVQSPDESNLGDKYVEITKEEYHQIKEELEADDKVE